MRLALAAMLLLPAATIATAADDDTVDLLQAVSVKEYVYLTLDGDDGFYYAVDRLGGRDTPHKIKEGLTFTQSGKGINVHLDYLNPLEYSWTVAQKDTADPSAEALRKFAESFNALVDVLAPPKAEADGAAGPRPARGFARGAEKKETLDLRAPDLLEWSLWTQEKTGDDCIAASSKEKPEAWKAFSAALQNADENLYGAASTERPSARFTGAAGDVVRVLLAADTLRALDKALGTAREKVPALELLDAQAAEALAALDKARTANPMSSKCGTFAAYTTLVMARFEKAGAEVLAARQALVKDLKAVLADIAGRRGKLPLGEKDNFFTVASADDLQAGKMRDLTLVVHRREVTEPSAERPALGIVEKDAVKATFRVRERQTLIAEFAPGVVYTTIAYPRFGTAVVDGRTVVKRGADEKLAFAPVAMLNLVPNIGWSGNVYLVGQVGIGLARDYPLLAVGGGLRFARVAKLSITAGWAWTWVRDLESLAEGDTVTGTADIEKDLRYRLTKGSLYVGIQKGF